MNSVCLRSRTEFINKDTDSLISSSIVSTEKIYIYIFSQQYISYNFYHLTSRVYGELLTLPSPRQEVCTAYDTRRACNACEYSSAYSTERRIFSPYHISLYTLVYSKFAPTWHGDHVGGQSNSPFSHSSQCTWFIPKILHTHCSQFFWVLQS